MIVLDQRRARNGFLIFTTYLIHIVSIFSVEVPRRLWMPRFHQLGGQNTMVTFYVKANGANEALDEFDPSPAHPLTPVQPLEHHFQAFQPWQASATGPTVKLQEAVVAAVLISGPADHYHY